MATTLAETITQADTLQPCQNELVADFSKPENRAAMERALATVRAQLGREYDILIAGKRIKTGDLLKSLNPSRPTEVVGIHHRATTDLANRAVEDAFAYFPEWSATLAAERIAMLGRVASIIRDRKFEFDAWLVYEASTTWPEADADVCE